MSQYNGPRPKINYNVLSEWKLRLEARPLENSIVDKFNRPRKPNIYFSVKDNQPQLTVRTNVQDDKDYGKIDAALDAHTWSSILAAIEMAANGTLTDADGSPIDKLYFDCKGYVFPGGKRSEQPVVKNMVIVGLTENREVYMSVVARERPNIQFIFGPSEWHEVNGNDGRPVNNHLKAKLYAMGYVKLMRDLTTSVLITEYKTPDQITAEKEARKQNRGGGNYGGGNSGGNGGGYQKPAQAPAPSGDEDNIPW